MSVFSQFFLAFMSRDFSQFALSSAGHLILLGFWNNYRLKPYIDYAGKGKKGQVRLLRHVGEKSRTYTNGK